MSFRGTIAIEVAMGLGIMMMLVLVTLKSTKVVNTLWVRGAKTQTMAGLNYARSAAMTQQQPIDIGGDSNQLKWISEQHSPKKVGFTPNGTTRFANTITIQKGDVKDTITVGVGIGKVSP